MSLYIGRCVFPTATGVAQEGETLTLTVDVDEEAAPLKANADAMRQNLIGLANNSDEPVIPVHWDEDPAIDGYYAVESVQVSPGLFYLDTGEASAVVRLRRVAGGYGSPTIETFVTSRVATNAHGVSAPDRPLIAAFRVEDDWEVDLSGLPPFGLESYVNSGETTTLYFANTLPATGFLRSGVPPLNFYQGTNACRFGFASSGLALVGRQVPRTAAGDWSITNGIVTLECTGDNDQRMTLRTHRTGTDPATQLAYGELVSGTFTEKVGNGLRGGVPIVLRNSPEVVAVRVTNGPGAPAFTYTLWRGASVVMITAQSRLNFTERFAIGVRQASYTGATAVTGGIRVPIPGLTNGQTVLLNRQAVNVSTTGGAIANTTLASTSVFSVGHYVSAATSGEYMTADGQLEQLCTPPQWVQRVVIR